MTDQINLGTKNSWKCSWGNVLGHVQQVLQLCKRFLICDVEQDNGGESMNQSLSRWVFNKLHCNLATTYFDSFLPFGVFCCVLAFIDKSGLPNALATQHNH